MAKDSKSIPYHNKSTKKFIHPRNSQTAQQDMNTKAQDIKMQIVRCMLGNRIANQYGNGNVVTAPAEGNGNGINGNPIRCYNCRGEGHYASNCTVKPRKRDAVILRNSEIVKWKRSGDPKHSKWNVEFMVAADAYKENERVKVNAL
ncbi:zf-CCHC domain-containing protein [Tanacetum coccineum]